VGHQRTKLCSVPGAGKHHAARSRARAAPGDGWRGFQRFRCAVAARIPPSEFPCSHRLAEAGAHCTCRNPDVAAGGWWRSFAALRGAWRSLGLGDEPGPAWDPSEVRDPPFPKHQHHRESRPWPLPPASPRAYRSIHGFAVPFPSGIFSWNARVVSGNAPPPVATVVRSDWDRA